MPSEKPRPKTAPAGLTPKVRRASTAAPALPHREQVRHELVDGDPGALVEA